MPSVKFFSGRAAVVVVALVAALVALALLVVWQLSGTDDSSDAVVALDERHLPTAVNAPGTWSSDEGVRGPVAAVGVAMRTEPVGIFESRERLAAFAVSAVDGSASWLRLPGHSLEHYGFAGGLAVSPDGEWIGWARPPVSSGPRLSERVAGWSVMNTTTGDVRRLEVTGSPWVLGTMSDLKFSGDSGHLLTSFETPGRTKAQRSRGHQLVAWDVREGDSAVVEQPGPYWLPSLGSAPTGVTWARGQRVYRVDPVAGGRSTLTLPRVVVTASWGPDDVSFAYVGRSTEKRKGPWRLYAGRTVAEARQGQIDLPAGVQAAELMGWRDATHVVVGDYRSEVHVVDVVTGEVESIDLSGHGEQMTSPYLATELWQQPLVAPVEPDGTTDPRTWWRWVGGAALVLLAGALFLLWRRSSRLDRDASIGLEARPLPSLRPLSTVATGLLLVMLDFKINGFDLIPDPVGLVIAAVALGSLESVHRGFGVAGVAAWLAVVPSSVEWIGAEGSLITIPITLALTVLEVAVCTAIIVTRPNKASAAATIRGLSVFLGGALVVLLSIPGIEAEQGSTAVVLAIALAALLVMVWFVVLLYTAAKDVAADSATHQVGWT